VCRSVPDAPVTQPIFRSRKNTFVSSAEVPLICFFHFFPPSAV
jgi:hypothetical protein